MSYNYTQEDIDLIYQNKLNLYIKIDLLNENFQIVENLQGELIDGNYVVDAESDIRRNIDLTLFVKDSSFLIGQDTKIWLDKYIKVKIGIKNFRTGNIVYYNIGTYLFNDMNYSYNSTTKTLTIQCVDLMAKFTGLRGGQVRGLQTIIYEGSDIRQAIIDTVSIEGKYPKYRVDNRKNRQTIENLFNKNSSSNKYVNCALESETNRLIFTIPKGETEGSLTIYNVSSFKFGVTYTVPDGIFLWNEEPNVNYTPLCRIVGIDEKGDEKIQENLFAANIGMVSEFTIDESFMQIKSISFITKLDKTYDEEIQATVDNFWIFEGSGYTSNTAPAFIEYDAQGVVPYDLEFNTGSTIYEILTELNNLEQGWEFFFDINDTFINQKIPTTIGSPYVLDWEILSPLIIQEGLNTSFESVKNSTRIWGKCLSPDRYGSAVVDGSMYDLELNYLIGSDDKDIPSNILIAISFPNELAENMTVLIKDNYANPHLEGTGLEYDVFIKTVKLYGNGNLPLDKNYIQPDTPYVFKYKNSGLYLQGQTQICYVVKEYNELPLKDGQSKEEWIAQDKTDEGTKNVKYIINSESEYITNNMTEAEKRQYYNPFAIDEIGEIRQVLSDGDYEKIYTDDLARQRAEYENWKAMRLNTNLTLEIKPIFWLDVNQKIQYKSKTTGKIEEYIIKTISYTYSTGIMTIEAVKFFPLYPFIVEDE